MRGGTAGSLQCGADSSEMSVIYVKAAFTWGGMGSMIRLHAKLKYLKSIFTSNVSHLFMLIL